MNELKKKKNI
jgi:hypothetical protein